MEIQEKDWVKYPKFRHNLWTNFADEPEITYLTVSHGKFEVSTEEATEFLKIRGFCTGHHSIEQIAHKSGLAEQRTKEIVNSLVEGDVLRVPQKSFEQLSEQDIQQTLLAATRI